MIRVCHYLNNLFFFLFFLTRSSTTGFITQLKRAMLLFHQLRVQIFCLKAFLVFSSAQGCVSIPRVFDFPSIPLLSFHVHALCQNGSCTSLEAIPTNIRIVESTMRLVAATFFSCGHYNAAFCGKDRQWYFYDGLQAVDVHINFASPVDHIPVKILNHIIFINEKFLSEL